MIPPDSCGGCAGLGRHKRWCPAAVGRSAAFLGTLSERAESLGDTVGANETGAANHLYRAATLLREAAREREIEWRENARDRPDPS